ncbi:hypothetical protein ACFYNY_16065 [Streptomyces sp. NPDC006530]|uniref:hypothetical protein n=1 Tax=Streptomyces sp. NPDC006530 TaxID=3364750 RepID=UPI0036CC2965
MHSFSRTTALASVGLTAALVLAGCSSDGSDRASDKPSGTASATAPTGSGPSHPAAPGASTPAQGKGGGATASSQGGATIDGEWVAVTQGKPVALVIKGKAASVLGEHLCSGTANSAAGTATLRLTCPDKNTNRTRGTAKLNGAKLEVSWDGFGKDEFSRNTTTG